MPVSAGGEKKKIDIAYLDTFATNQFDCILHYMVEPSGQRQPNASVKRLLLNSGLMRPLCLPPAAPPAPR